MPKTLEIVEVSTSDEDGYESMILSLRSDGTEVGEASVLTSSTGAYVERIDIDESKRNRGLGTEFLRLLSERLGGIYLAPDNADAQRLYARIGQDYHGADAEYVDQGYGVYKII